MISLIMLSWERPSLTIANINIYLTYEIISEIFVVNNNNKVQIPDINSKKVTLIQNSRDLGLYTRFTTAGLAKNDCIMHCDDDLLVPEPTILFLYEKWKQRSLSCHGTQGRIVSDSYNLKNVWGQVHVVLTRCMLVHRLNCIRVLEHLNNFRDLDSVPEGNGEDIIISFLASNVSGSPNYVYKISYYDHPESKFKEDDGIAISKRWDRHMQHRSGVVRACTLLWGLHQIDDEN